MPDRDARISRLAFDLYVIRKSLLPSAGQPSSSFGRPSLDRGPPFTTLTPSPNGTPNLMSEKPKKFLPPLPIALPLSAPKSLTPPGGPYCTTSIPTVSVPIDRFFCTASVEYGSTSVWRIKYTTNHSPCPPRRREICS